MPVEKAAAHGYGLFSARYGNIYVVRHLLQLFEEAHRGVPNEDCVWSKAERFVDAFRPTVEPNGLGSPEDVRLHREYHLRAVRQMFRQVHVFVFTLGLTEAWMSATTDRVFPVCPGTVAGTFDPTRYRFANFTFDEIYRDFVSFYRKLKAINPSVRIILTISPVPLTATASDEHVLVATTYSKAVLRAVAGQLCRDLADVDYFPSFEIITNPAARGIFYEPNLRTVTDFGVQTVMRAFMSAHGIVMRGGKASGSRRERMGGSSDRSPGAISAESPVICEDELLEAFAK